MDMMEPAAPVTPELVRWAYRLLLGREPESLRVVEDWAAGHDLEGLRQGILSSTEFASNAISGAPERGEWAEEPASRPAIEAMLRLRDHPARPDPAEVEGLLAGGPTARDLRRSLLGSPALEAWMPRREGLRRRVLRLGEASFTVTGDSRDAEFMGLPGLAPAFAAVARAAWPDGGEGRAILDAGAGTGLASLALVAGAPRYGQLLAFEESLPRAAMLAANLGFLPRATLRATALPPPGALDAPPGLLRLAVPEADAVLAQWGPALREAGALVLLRLDLAALLLERRGDPRGFLAGLLAAWPAVALLDDPAEPRPLEGEAGVDAALRAALADPAHRAELVLSTEAGWLDRYAL